MHMNEIAEVESPKSKRQHVRHGLSRRDREETYRLGALGPAALEPRSPAACVPWRGGRPSAPR
eukprot:3523668-Prymnesium_polylepis.1